MGDFLRNSYGWFSGGFPRLFGVRILEFPIIALQINIIARWRFAFKRRWRYAANFVSNDVDVFRKFFCTGFVMPTVKGFPGP